MQRNPMIGVETDLLWTDTVPTIVGWSSLYVIPDINAYKFLVISCISSDDGSYSYMVSTSDFKNMSATYAFILYGTSNSNRIMVCYSSDTQFGVYNTHGSCTITIRGIK